MQLPDRGLEWPIPWAGVIEVARSEGCRLEAYQDIVGVWTIGWGRTRGVHEGMRQTQAEADEDLLDELCEITLAVEDCLTVEATDNELAAMVSLAYNIGMGWHGPKKPKGAKDGFRQSTVLRAHNRLDSAAAARAFALWNKAGGKVIAGLVARRAREAALYLTPQEPGLATVQITRMSAPGAAPPAVDDAPQPATPEADAESRLRTSPIVQSGVASIVTGTLAAASAVSDDVQRIAADLAISPLAILAAVGIATGVVVLWQRHKQRREGWA